MWKSWNTIIPFSQSFDINVLLFQVIVYPTKESLQLFGATLILLLIWIVALMLAMPLFIIRHLAHHTIPLTGDDCLNINFCIENWPVEHGRAYYSIFSLIFQYTLPIIIVSVSQKTSKYLNTHLQWLKRIEKYF